jgi:type III secretion protein S
MQTAQIVEVLHRAMVVVVITAAPAVIAAAVVGLLVAVVQAATQLQDQSFSQALKLSAVVIVLLVGGASMGGEVVRFGDQIFNELSALSR